jgi:hypothetical protein
MRAYGKIVNLVTGHQVLSSGDGVNRTHSSSNCDDIPTLIR